MSELELLARSWVSRLNERFPWRLCMSIVCLLSILSLQEVRTQDYLDDHTNWSKQYSENDLLNSTLKIPDQCQDKMKTTPNFWQKDPRADFPNGGKEYCGPVAVSDSLMWFGKHGFAHLIPPAQDEYNAQEQLIRILASEAFLETDAEHNGTSSLHVLEGILKFVTNRGYRVNSLQYQGINPKIPLQFRAGDFPDLGWICKNSLGNSGAILHIGWYKYSSDTNTYVRNGGHFMDIVGYAEANNDRGRLPALIVHNPSTGKQALLKIEQLTDGSLQSGKRRTNGLPRPAAGMYKIVSGLPSTDTPGSHKIAIIEDSIVFRLYLN